MSVGFGDAGEGVAAGCFPISGHRHRGLLVQEPSFPLVRLYFEALDDKLEHRL